MKTLEQYEQDIQRLKEAGKEKELKQEQKAYEAYCAHLFWGE